LFRDTARDDGDAARRRFELPSQLSFAIVTWQRTKYAECSSCDKLHVPPSLVFSMVDALSESRGMVEPRAERLLAFAKKLQRAATFTDLLVTAREEAREAVGYAHVWFMVADSEDAEELRLIDISGGQRELVWEVAPVLKVKGDPFLEELLRSDVPVVIPDARSDPRTNKQIVEKLQNRTLINIPLRLLDKPFGLFGLGTFGDEGCRAPDAPQLDYLVGMASQIVVAASRIRFLEARARAEKERLELERRLSQMQKLESLGMLAGGIAHDFNNLLTVIIASAGLAEQQAADPSLAEDIQAILGAAKRGKDLTQQLLAMSRSQALKLGALDLNLQLRKLLALVRRILPESIVIDLIEGKGLPFTEGDSGQIDQVFMNLFINARDAMSEGGRLTIETEQVVVNGKYAESHPWAKPGRYVLVTVTDTGTGITREVMERVFEPLFTTKGSRAGTGLGLATAYGIVQQHRGMLHCYSEVGVGTSFKVYLPVVEQLASAVGTKLQRAVPSGRERILVAEDDELVRAVAVKILERGGYAVSAVEHGEAACRAVAEEAFDLLILDVVMPGMSCRDVIARVRVVRPNIPILLSSGYTASTNVALLREEPGLKLLSKPYDPDRMLRTVRASLDDQPEEPSET
jgi:signal transduction histidine kinase/ActR/RegA family two-component response regulator